MVNEPIFFEKNRVSRVYEGGRLFADFFGDDSVDSDYPEEWIASSVRAWDNGNEGLSKVKGNTMYFDELLEQYHDACLGENGTFDVLVKVLDSAIRLPAQAHPDRAFSKKYFHSEHGKAESWIVLGTRENACLYFGFKEGVTPEMFKQAIDDSMTDSGALERLMCKYPVHVGDVYFVPARTIHAIGAGCLILEVQEPTDFTIEPEHWCGTTRIAEEKMYLGLDKDTAVSCFDFVPTTIQAKIPQVLQNTDGVVYEKLIGAEDTPCFCVNRITVRDGEFTLPHAPATYVVTDGNGILCSETYRKEIKKGDYFFMPYVLKSKINVQAKNIQIAECY